MKSLKESKMIPFKTESTTKMSVGSVEKLIILQTLHQTMVVYKHLCSEMIPNLIQTMLGLHMINLTWEIKI